MKLVTFSESGARKFRVGAMIEQGDGVFVVDFSQIDASLPASMRALLRAVDGDFTSLAAAVDSAPKKFLLPLTDLVFGPVVPDPEKVICIGLNYRDHAAETGHVLPETPTIFAKFANSLIGSGEPIIAPPNNSRVDYEAELACLIGRRAKGVLQEDALDYVAGYTIFNDVSARDYQLRTSQWTLGKSFDTFAPIGPALVTADEVPDPHALRITLKIGEEVLQDSNTSNLVFKIPELISHISSVITLEPGDVIATGTPAGVGFTRKPPRYLRAGDVVQIEIERLGVLINPVQATEPGSLLYRTTYPI